MWRHGRYRRPALAGLLSMVLANGCYVLPAASPPAGSPGALAPVPPPVGAAAVAACSPASLSEPAAVAVADAEDQERPAPEEAAWSRAELERLKQEIISLRERIGNAEKENLETIRSIVDALDQVLQQDKRCEPALQPSEFQQPPAPGEKPAVPILPELPPLKRNSG
jgi:hypothetical protein